MFEITGIDFIKEIKMYKKERDFLDGCIIWGFAAFTFVINTPLSIGFFIGGLVDSNFFIYGMIGGGICGGVSLMCIATFVIPLAIETAQESARKSEAKKWEKIHSSRYEKDDLDSIYQTFEEKLKSNPGCLEDKTHSYF